MLWPSTSGELAFTINDLDIVTTIEARDPLALTKYLRALDSLDATMLTFSPLESFAIWRDNQHSFYLSDDGRASAILSVGRARSLREYSTHARDTHLVPLPGGRGLAEVERKYDDMPVPIYLTANAGVPGYFIETDGFCGWVVVERVPVHVRLVSSTSA